MIVPESTDCENRDITLVRYWLSTISPEERTKPRRACRFLKAVALRWPSEINDGSMPASIEMTGTGTNHGTSFEVKKRRNTRGRA